MSILPTPNMDACNVYYIIIYKHMNQYLYLCRIFMKMRL